MKSINPQITIRLGNKTACGAAIALKLGFFCLVFALVVVSSRSVMAAVSIPGADHFPFVYSDWRGDRPSVVLFMDPLCPYCKKLIPKLHRITDYNLYIFWAPIFGERSEQAMSAIFRCETPSNESHVTQYLGAKGAQRGFDVCEGKYNQRLRDINDQMVDSYEVKSVPSFYVQGVRTSFAQVSRLKIEPPKRLNGVVINWNRYQSLKNGNSSSANHGLALIIPKALEHRAFQQDFPAAYLFSETDSASAVYYHEIVELLGLKRQSAYYISYSGKVSELP